MSFDVRCFLVPARDAVVLVDTGMAGILPGIEAALERVGAAWSDVADVILTHSHPDHVGGLEEVVRKVPGARIRIGREDLGSVSSSAPLRSLSEGDRIWGLQVIETPGHTKGHISLLSHDEGLLFVGDAVGSMGGMVVRPPAAFTADAAMAEKSLRKLCALSPARTLFSHGAEVPDAALQIQALLSGQPESLPESGH